MKSLKYNILCLLLLCQIIYANVAQELVKSEFRVFPVSHFDYDGIFYRPAPEAEMSEIRFRPRARSLDSYSYQGPETLVFYRKDGRDHEGFMQYRPVAQVAVKAPELLVFFAPKNTNGKRITKFSLLGMDDSPSALPADHVTFLNFTKVPFACRFMDKNLTIRPGPNAPISVRSQLAKDVLLGMAITNNESHRVVLKSRWQFHPDNRHYVLLLPPAREGSFRIRAFQISQYVGSDQRFTNR